MPQGTEVGSIFVRLGLDTSELQQGIDNAKSSLANMGRQLEETGRTLSAAVTAPALAAGAASVKAAGDFEESFSRMEGLVGVASDQVQQFRGDVLRLSGDTAQSPRELARALFFVTSAGLEGEQAIGALEASARAAAAGLGTTKTVADAATSAMNAFGKETLSAQEATDVLVATVREGKVEPDQLAESLGKVIPTAASVGVEFEQVGAALAAMTRQGANARRATTALNSLLTQTQKPSEDAKKTLQSVGLSIEDLRKRIQEDGLLAVMNLLQQEFQGNSDALVSLFGNVRAMRAALQLTGENADETRQIFSELADTTGATNAAFKEAKDTFSFRFKAFRSAVERLRIELGNALLPVATRLTGAVRDLIDDFASLTDEAKANALAWGALAAAAGPALIVIGKLTQATAGLVGALTALNATTSLIVGAIATLAATATVVVNEWQDFRSFFGQILDNVVGSFRAGADLIGALWDQEISRMKLVFAGLARRVLGLFGDIASFAASSGLDMASPLAGIFTLLEQQAQSSARSAADSLTSAASDVESATSRFQSNASSALVGILGTQSFVASQFKDTWQDAVSFVEGQFDRLESLFMPGGGAGSGGDGGVQPAGPASSGGSIGDLLPNSPVGNIPTAEEARRATERLRQMRSELTNTVQVGRRMRGVLGNALQGLRTGIGDVVGSLVTGQNEFQSFGDVARQVLKQVVSQVTQLIIQMTIFKTILSSFSFFSGGGDGSFVPAPGPGIEGGPIFASTASPIQVQVTGELRGDGRSLIGTIENASGELGAAGQPQ